MTEITLPEMGEGVIEGTLARWLVREGDRVERYAPIAEVETDKVTTETTTETAGTVLRLLVAEGETIPVGTVLAVIGEPGEESDEPSARDERRATSDEPGVASGEWRVASKEVTHDDRQPPTADGTAVASATDLPPATPYIGRISPVVGRIAAEHGVELGRVAGKMCIRDRLRGRAMRQARLVILVSAVTVILVAYIAANTKALRVALWDCLLYTSPSPRDS